MRYKVDFEHGYISYDEKDFDKAMEVYKERGIRLLRCRDIFDEGIVIAGPPVISDLTKDYSAIVN